MGSVTSIRVGLAQLNSELGNTEVNLRRAEEYIGRAAAERCDLVMLPELYLQGYRADELFVDVAEPIPGPTTARLETLARQHDISIVMGMGRREESFPHLVYNSLCFVGPDGLLGHYDKVHLGTFHPYMEGVYFAPGQRAPVFETRFGRVSLQICYDSWFPELTRTYAVKGSILNLVISAGPSGSEDPWKTMLRARSMENLFPSVYCNTVGKQKDFSFFGGSKIISAAGKVTTEAKLDEEDFVVGEVDLEEGPRLRRHWLLFRERNPRVYAPLTAANAPDPDAGWSGVHVNGYADGAFEQARDGVARSPVG
jgi:predicted amidohydrolase